VNRLDLPLEVITPFRVIAYGVPALMVLGGILLLLFGYPIELSTVISSGWSLVIFGSLIYVSELVLLNYGNR
jgi:hypothetical protein